MRGQKSVEMKTTKKQIREIVEPVRHALGLRISQGSEDEGVIEISATYSWSVKIPSQAVMTPDRLADHVLMQIHVELLALQRRICRHKERIIQLRVKNSR